MKLEIERTSGARPWHVVLVTEEHPHRRTIRAYKRRRQAGNFVQISTSTEVPFMCALSFALDEIADMRATSGRSDPEILLQTACQMLRLDFGHLPFPDSERLVATLRVELGITPKPEMR